MPIERTGWVLDLDRFALHDGPGIRMTVFLKGCPLRCAWCHSPESQRLAPELLYQRARCQGCFLCAAACPTGAIAPDSGAPSIAIDRARCERCFRCARACPNQALRIAGRRMTPEALLEIAHRDQVYYRQSGGGVTISGGEPLMQPDFALAVLRGLNAMGIHAAIETSGMGDADRLIEIARHTDLLMFDLKLLDPEMHRRYTGASNVRILSNLRALCADPALRPRIFVRTPLIPGINDDLLQITEIARHLSSLGVRHMDVLPYNQMAQAKYEWLGAPFPLGVIEPREKGYDEALRALIRREGLSTEFISQEG